MPIPAGAIAERRLIDRLLRARAFTPDTAQPLADLRWVEGRRLQRLLAKHVILEPQPGRYYLDGPALADRFAALRWFRAIALMFVIVALMVMVLLSGAGSSRIAF
jgi:hypothetical protein